MSSSARTSPELAPVRLVLVGMMGSGKTSVGRALALMTGWQYADNDELVLRSSGREPAEIRETDGEDALHALEVRALVEALRSPPPALIGAAGYVVIDDVAVRALRAGAVVVWLRARPSTLRARIGSGEGRRAEATDERWLTREAEAREDRYRAVADLTIDVDDLAVGNVADAIVGFLEMGSQAPTGSQHTS